MEIQNYFDEIYIINLDGRKDRLDYMKKELVKIGIKRFKRFSAIETSLEKIPKEYYNNFDKSKEINKKYIEGSVGCKLSHVGVILDAKKQGHKKILVMEDDIFFREDTKEIFSNAIEQLGKIKWELFYLGGLYEFGGYYNDGSKWEQKRVSNNLLKLQGAIEACCYGVNESIYDEILNNALFSGREIDNFYLNLMYYSSYKFYGVYPVIAKQITKGDVGKSNIK